MTIRYRVILCGVLILAVFVGFQKPAEHNDVYTKTFCAYGKVFVEFEDNGHKWGTLMLDWQGRPTMCDTNETTVKPGIIL